MPFVSDTGGEQINWSIWKTIAHISLQTYVCFLQMGKKVDPSDRYFSPQPRSEIFFDPRKLYPI